MNTTFSRFLAVLAVAGLFYVGAGLHSSSSDAPLSVLGTARAQSPATAVIAQRQPSNNYLFVTGAEGKVVHVWRISTGGTLTYEKKYGVP